MQCVLCFFRHPFVHCTLPPATLIVRIRCRVQLPLAPKPRAIVTSVGLMSFSCIHWSPKPYSTHYTKRSNGWVAVVAMRFTPIGRVPSWRTLSRCAAVKIPTSGGYSEVSIRPGPLPCTPLSRIAGSVGGRGCGAEILWFKGNNKQQGCNQDKGCNQHLQQQ